MVGIAVLECVSTFQKLTKCSKNAAKVVFFGDTAKNFPLFFEKKWLAVPKRAKALSFCFQTYTKYNVKCLEKQR